MSIQTSNCCRTFSRSIIIASFCWLPDNYQEANNKWERWAVSDSEEYSE